MKRNALKVIGILLSLGMLLATFSACEMKEDTQPTEDNVIPAAVVTVTIEADGKEFVIENAQGKTVEQLLEQAEIVLEDGDMLSVATDRELTDMVIRVLRQKKITVEIKNTDDQVEKEYVAVLMDGTVEDALKLLGVELAENQQVNFDLSKTLEDEMKISISTQEQEPEPTEPEEEDDNNSGSGNSGSGNSGSGNSGSGNSGSGNSGSGNSGGDNSGDNSGSGDSGNTETQPQKTVVNVDYYYDCDGSGHGVKVITYSDGTQEEVPF